MRASPIETHEPAGVGSQKGNFRSHFRLVCHQASVSTMGLMDSSFEQALTRHLRTELDALYVAVPAVPGYSGRRRSLRYGWAVARPLAVAVAAALLLSSVAAFASGSPNPKVWVTEAEHSLGVQAPDDEIAPGAAPSPHPSESPDPGEDRAVAPGSRVEPSEKPTAEPVERQAPEPADGAPEGDG
jgi:hypothetical protein